jgi:hypothetical protein
MPLSMPVGPGFSACRFGLETNTQTFTSPLTRATQRALLGGARWTATYTLPAMNNAQAAAWQAFLLSLEGGVNTFYAFDPDRKTPRGAATGTPLVNGGSQTGSSLVTDGWAHSVTGVLKAGDYFGVNGELKMVAADCNSDGSGNATIAFKPALRSSPADNAPLTVTAASCTMVLQDDQQTMWDTGVRIGIYNSKTFSAYEVFG